MFNSYHNDNSVVDKWNKVLFITGKKKLYFKLNVLKLNRLMDLFSVLLEVHFSSCITNRAYSILGSVSVLDIKITFFGLEGSNMVYVGNTDKVIFQTCWREVVNTFKTKCTIPLSNIMALITFY